MNPIWLRKEHGLFKVADKSAAHKVAIIVKEINTTEEKLYSLCRGKGVLRVGLHTSKIVLCL